MKKKGFFRLTAFLLALLCALALTAPAHADMGPKASLNITVINAPEGTVYVDLLHQTPNRPYGGLDDIERARYDPAILELLYALEGDGWYLACSSGTGGAPISGDLQPDAQGIYTYGYYGLPETFRVAVATAGGAQATTESYTRSRFVTNLIYDWNTNTLYEAIPSATLFLAQLAATLIPTLIIEGLILLLFKFRQKRSWLGFLLVNVVTQLGLHLVCRQFIGSAMQTALYYFIDLFLPEIVILLVEAAAYRFLLKDSSGKRPILYALCANLASFVLGFFPLHWLSGLLNSL